MDFKALIEALSTLNNEFKEHSIREVNTSLRSVTGVFGYYTTEFKQNGKNRVEYRKALLSKIASAMKALSIPNPDERELRRYRQFCMADRAAANLISANHKIRGLLPPEIAKKQQYNC